MKFEFTKEEAREFGKELESFLKEFSDQTEMNRENLVSMHSQFHALAQETNGHVEQAERFSNKLWKLVEKRIKQDFANSQSSANLQETKAPIIIEFKGGLDVILDTSTNDGEFCVNSLNIDKGGLAANSSEALARRNTKANMLAFYGQGKIAEIQESLLQEAGVEPNVVRYQGDTFFHPCINYKDENGKENLFWLVAQSYPHQADELDEFNKRVKELSEANAGEFFVLTNMPPKGTQPDYFAKLSKIAKSNQNIVLYNPCEFMDTYLVDRYLFKEGEVDIVKPNLHELTQFLVSLDLLEMNQQAALREQINKELDKGDFSTVMKYAKDFMAVSNVKVALISIGKHGALTVTNRDVIHTSAPGIELVCSSGAGDTGLAGLIKAARSIGFKIENFTEQDLIKIVEEFVLAASATAAKSGNQIADESEVETIRNKVQWSGSKVFQRYS